MAGTLRSSVRKPGRKPLRTTVSSGPAWPRAKRRGGLHVLPGASKETCAETPSARLQRGVPHTHSPNPATAKAAGRTPTPVLQEPLQTRSFDIQIFLEWELKKNLQTTPKLFLTDLWRCFGKLDLKGLAPTHQAHGSLGVELGNTCTSYPQLPPKNPKLCLDTDWNSRILLGSKQPKVKALHWLP